MNLTTRSYSNPIKKPSRSVRGVRSFFLSQDVRSDCIDRFECVVPILNV